VATFKGYGKRTPIREDAPKGRATGGVATVAQKTLDVTGRIAAARMVRADDDLTIITAGGSTMGRCMMQLNEGDSIASVARLSADLQEEADGGEAAAPPAPEETEAPPDAGG